MEKELQKKTIQKMWRYTNHCLYYFNFHNLKSIPAIGTLIELIVFA